mmetsp:Transcript_11638/g.12495  ORF Transcript_11638/g.12495 Transcript_11638/m.12495 type:complete len:98 (+) Transcript_11638:1160-1453(+)
MIVLLKDLTSCGLTDSSGKGHGTDSGHGTETEVVIFSCFPLNMGWVNDDIDVVGGMMANKGFGTDPDSLPLVILASIVVCLGGLSFRLREDLAEETR